VLVSLVPVSHLESKNMKLEFSSRFQRTRSQITLSLRLALLAMSAAAGAGGGTIRPHRRIATVKDAMENGTMEKA
jgi:hypothetical protein